jgi:hypothetical protein
MNLDKHTTCFLCLETITEDDHEANGGLCDRCLKREMDDEAEIAADGV